jgi:hypothetical protein
MLKCDPISRQHKNASKFNGLNWTTGAGDLLLKVNPRITANVDGRLRALMDERIESQHIVAAIEGM